MKRLLAAILLAGAAFLAGCQLLTKPVVTQVKVPVPASTNIVTTVQYVTNVVKGENIIVTNREVSVVYAPPTERTVFVTNYVANPALISGAQTVQEINSTLNPTPSAPFINLGLGALTLLAGGLAAWQNRRAAGSNALVSTLTTAVETFDNPDLKKLIAGTALAHGTSDALHEAVQTMPTVVNKTTV